MRGKAGTLHQQAFDIMRGTLIHAVTTCPTSFFPALCGENEKWPSKYCLRTPTAFALKQYNIRALQQCKLQQPMSLCINKIQRYIKTPKTYFCLENSTFSHRSRTTVDTEMTKGQKVALVISWLLSDRGDF